MTSNPQFKSAFQPPVLSSTLTLTLKPSLGVEIRVIAFLIVVIIIKDFVKLIADFKNKTDVFTVFGDFSLLFLSLAGRTVNKVAVW